MHNPNGKPLWVALIVSPFFTQMLAAFNPSIGDFSKANPHYVRVMTYNLEKKFIDGTAEENAALDRILLSLNPDVVCFQEVVPSTSATAIATRLQTVLGGTWQINTGISDGFNYNAVGSRFPFISQGNDSVPASELRGLTWAFFDLPNATYSTDLYVISVHFKASSGASNDARRQITADAAANWFADLTTPGGQTNLPANTPILISGDFNIADSFSQQPWTTLLTGNIINNATYGPDRPGDWDGSNIAEFLPRDCYDLDFHTHPSGSDNPSTRLDRVAYTDSVATVAQAFVFNDASMSSTQRTGAGLLLNDTATSDHLPFVVDFAVGGIAINEPQYGDILITEIQADPTLVPDSTGEYVELHNWTETTYNLSGLMLTSFSSNAAGFTSDVLQEGELPAGEFWLLGKSLEAEANGGISVDQVATNLGLSNTGGDSVELWRGSVKLDGIRYGNGPIGSAPENLFWESQITSGISFELKGDLSAGRTSQIGLAEVFYNSQDKGTPGRPSEAIRESEDFFLFY